MTVSKHFCGDTLKSISVITEPKSCCDTPSRCCHNEIVVVDIEDEFSAPSFQYNFEQLAVLVTMVLQFENYELEETARFVVYYETPPPPVIQTVLSRLQTYLL